MDPQPHPFEPIVAHLAETRLRATPDDVRLSVDDAAVLVDRPEPLPAGMVRALLAQGPTTPAEYLVLRASRRQAAATLAAQLEAAKPQAASPARKTSGFFRAGGGLAQFH